MTNKDKRLYWSLAQRRSRERRTALDPEAARAAAAQKMRLYREEKKRIKEKRLKNKPINLDKLWS